MSTKLFVIAIAVLGAIVAAGIFVSMSRTDTNAPSTNKDSTAVTFTVDDVKKHDSKSDCWTIISGSVYDLTSYLPRHPGGDEILRACGADSTKLFETRTTDDGETVGSGQPHSRNAKDQLESLYIGDLQ